MSGDVSRKNQSLFCFYHQDRGHMTKDYRTLKDHLGQLKKVGHLKEFIAWDSPDLKKGRGQVRHEPQFLLWGS